MDDYTFFYPNCCHVCKLSNVELISCAKCKMIFYCSEMHQQLHLPQHKEICDAIKLVLEDKEYMNTEEISVEKWLYIRKMYLDKVSVTLQRDLKIEEIEMILFPKACVVCHRQDIVIRCNDCRSAAFCDKHKHDSEHRENHCRLLMKSFVIKKWMAVTKNIIMPYVNCISDTMPFYDMQSFLDIYIPSDQNNVHFRMLHSSLISNPLTVYFCIVKLGYLKCKTLSIHVIGAHIITYPAGIDIWKMLLRLIPTLTTLTITFIQARRVFSECEVSEETANVLETKKLVTHIYYMPYEEYVGTTDFKKPNFIVGFGTKIINDSYATNKYVEISDTSGSALADQNCPCILIMDYLDLFHKEILNKIENLVLATNPFQSLMPLRDCISERICYSNNYLITFNDLDSSRVFITKTNQCVLFSTTNRK